MLSVRSRSEQGFAPVRARCEHEPELLRRGSGFVLYALMDAVVDRYFPVVDALEAELERTEERIFSGAPARQSIEAVTTPGEPAAPTHPGPSGPKAPADLESDPGATIS